MGAQANAGTAFPRPWSGPCISRCNLDNSDVDWFADGNCNTGLFANSRGCEDQAGGTFTCL